MQVFQIIIFEIILGYLLQSMAFIIGMHGIAKQKLNMASASIVCVICAAATFFIRGSDLFNFGVHTMLVLLVMNASCIMICKMNIRASILGSILMMILVLLSELVNLGILSAVYGLEQATPLMEDPVFKAVSAVPGNLVLLFVSLPLYRLRTRGGKQNESSQFSGR